MRGTILLVGVDRSDGANLDSAIGQWPFEVLEVGSIPDAWTRIARRQCDILLLDDDAVGGCHTEFLQKVRDKAPQVVRLYSLTRPENKTDQASALAWEILHKPWEIRHIMRVLRSAVMECYLSLLVPLHEPVVQVPSTDLPPKSGIRANVALSVREREVAVLLQGEHGCAQIARKLGVSPFTVRNHVKAIYEKLGVHSRAAFRLSAGGFNGL